MRLGVPAGCEDAAVPLQRDHERAAGHRQRPVHGHTPQRHQRADLRIGGPAAERQDEEGVHRYVHHHPSLLLQ